MIKVVLDTNILISALIRPDGLEAKLVDLGLARSVELCVSEALWAEYVEVLGRKKFAKRQQQADELLRKLAGVVCYYQPLCVVQAAGDPDDNLLLECAQAAGADYLATGNLKHFPMSWQSTVIASSRAILNDQNWI